MRHRGSARTTTRPLTRRARPGLSTNGRAGWASNISTASSAATPASGSRTCSATRPPSIPSRAIPAGTDDRDGRRRHRVHEPTQGDRSQQAVPLSTTCRAAPMRRIIRRRSGSRRSATCTSSTSGWNKVRETIFANQKRLGVMPEDAKLTPWPKDCRSGILSAARRRSSSSGRPTSMEPISPTPTTRSAG